MYQIIFRLIKTLLQLLFITYSIYIYIYIYIVVWTKIFGFYTLTAIIGVSKLFYLPSINNNHCKQSKTIGKSRIIVTAMIAK